MNNVEFRLDRFTRGVLAAITVLLTIIAIELWVGRPDVVAAANAQIPDSGRQRVEMTAELRRANGLLGGILDHLRTKPVKVRIVAPDKVDGQRPLKGRETGSK